MASKSWTLHTLSQDYSAVYKTSWSRGDSLIALGLCLGAFALRLPFQAALLNNFDAINYALALEHYDMRLSQPQAPGYPLYILFGRLFYAFLPEERAALTALSMVGSALAAVSLYWAGRTLFNRRVGWIAALLASLSTVVWFLSDIAAPYTLDLAFSGVAGAVCYQALHSKEHRWVWISGLVVGLAGAFRLQTLFFLLPLLAYALAFRPVSQGRWIGFLQGILLALGVFALFFVPAVYLSGGPQDFLRSMAGILPRFQDKQAASSSPRGLQLLVDLVSLLGLRLVHNGSTVFNYTLRILGELNLPWVLAGLGILSGSWKVWRSERVRFLLIWLLPSWVVYFLIWPGNIGTVLVSTAPLFLFAGVGLDGFLASAGMKRRLAQAGLTFSVMWLVIAFALLPEEPLGGYYRRFENYAMLRGSVENYRDRLALIAALPLDATQVYSDDFRVLQYYLPQARTFSLPRFNQQDPSQVRGIISIEQGAVETWREIPAEILVPAGIRYLVFWDRPKDINIVAPLELERHVRPEGSIFVLKLPEGAVIDWTGEGIQIRSHPTGLLP